MGAKAGQRGRPGRDRDDKAARRQRLGLIVFGAIFILLFVGFAIAQGLTNPSVPSGDAAHISSVPGEFGNISEDRVQSAIDRQLSAAKSKKTPKPGSKKYEEAKTAAVSEQIEGVWIRGQAEEMDISVTEKQVEDELATIKKQNFPTPSAYKKFLKESHFTQDEVNELVELQIFTKEIQAKIATEAPKPSSSAIEAYYEAEKATQFTAKESRDVRLILNEDKKEVEAAKAALEDDSSPASWKKVAKKYSSDPTSGAKGGLQEGITEEVLESSPPLKTAIFDSPTKELVGPVKFEKNWVLAEVVKLTPEKEQTLAEAKAQIESTLGQQTQQEYLAEFVADYEARWSSRTRCADDFLVKNCANFSSDGRPANASPACYEEDPKTPAKECPAPVTPTSPTLPGKVSVTKPKGEPFPQRPQPESSGEEAATELPPGAAPEGEAPPAEAPPAETGE
jgi:parvulin-like peptidyl-prolyl isomerase